VKRKIALPEEPPEAARVHQLFFAPSLIHARMASRSQIDSCFLLRGMRIAAGTFQSSIIIRLLESGAMRPVSGLPVTVSRVSSHYLNDA